MDAKLKNMLIKEFKPLEESKAWDLMVNSDLFIGVTPEDSKETPVHFWKPGV